MCTCTPCTHEKEGYRRQEELWQGVKVLVAMAKKVKVSDQGVGTNYPGSRPWSTLLSMLFAPYVCLSERLARANQLNPWTHTLPFSNSDRKGLHFLFQRVCGNSSPMTSKFCGFKVDAADQTGTSSSLLWSAILRWMASLFLTKSDRLPSLKLKRFYPRLNFQLHSQRSST